MYQLDSILNDDDIKYDHMAHAVTMHNKGVVHLVSGDFQMAVVQFQQAIKAKRAIEGIDQKNYILETMEQMGIALYACRDIDSATSTFQKIISMAPNDSSISTRAWNALGCCFNQNQKEQFAMQCFVKSSQLGESLIGKIALANLGYYKYRLGDPRAVNVMRDASESLQDFLGSDDSIVSNVNNNTKLAICDGIPNNILAMIR